MTYTIILTPRAEKHIAEWRKSGQVKTLQKVLGLITEISQHPYSGTGQAEQLRGNMVGCWSRRIDRGNRLVYTVNEATVTVHIISARGHYDDK